MAQCEANLTILEALEKPQERSPEFIIKLQDKIVPMSDRVKFECKVVGVPEPEITWYRDNEKLKEEPNKIRIESEEGVQRLVIENVDVGHEGVFVCVAENVAGKAETAAELKVESWFL